MRGGVGVAATGITVTGASVGVGDDVGSVVGGTAVEVRVGDGVGELEGVGVLVWISAPGLSASTASADSEGRLTWSSEISGGSVGSFASSSRALTVASMSGVGGVVGAGTGVGRDAARAAATVASTSTVGSGGGLVHAAAKNSAPARSVNQNRPSRSGFRLRFVFVIWCSELSCSWQVSLQTFKPMLLVRCMIIPCGSRPCGCRSRERLCAEAVTATMLRANRGPNCR